DPAGVKLKSLGDFVAAGLRPRQCRQWQRILIQERRAADAQPWINAFRQDPTEDVAPRIVVRRSDANARGFRRKHGPVTPPLAYCGQQVDLGVSREGIRDCQSLRRSKWIDGLAAKAKFLGTGSTRRLA